MQDTAATSTHMPERAPKPRRGGPSRLQTVGDYGGQLASEAAQAVRRAGLKPGLERSFGFAAELRGHIVAQEPEVGSELARNGLVTLYVAAPGTASSGELGAAGPAAGDHSEAKVTPRILADAEPASDLAGTAARRRKSRRPPRGGGATFDAPPPPSPPTVEETTEALSLDPRDHDEVEDDRASEQVIDAAELFAGRASAAAWRRIYPRRRRGFRSRLAGRSRLVLAALALVAVWLIVALGTALTGHRASPPPAAHARARTQTPPVGSVPARPSEHHAPMPHREAARWHSAPKRRRRRRPPTQRPAQRPTHTVTTRAATAPTAPTPTRPAPAPVQRDAEGGLFSP
jgi:hypothetical protein